MAKFNRTLCDTENVGKLNREQFALAMYLIAKKVKTNLCYYAMLVYICNLYSSKVHRNYELLCICRYKARNLLQSSHHK